MLIGYNPDLTEDWTNRCNEFENNIIREGRLPYLVETDMTIVLDAMVKMEEGSSSEELKDFISKESDGQPYRELTIARYVAHFGSSGHIFAEKIGIADLPQDIDDFRITKVNDTGEIRGI